MRRTYNTLARSRTNPIKGFNTGSCGGCHTAVAKLLANASKGSKRPGTQVVFVEAVNLETGEIETRTVIL